MDAPEYVAIESAAHVTGVPARTLRRWAAAGRVPVVTGQGKRLVRLDDTRRLAEATGHRPAVAGVPGGLSGGVTGQVSDPDDGEGARPAAPVAVPPAAMAQLEAIRDQWLRPLMERNEALAERAGRLEAERDQVTRERDALRAEVARLTPGEEGAVRRSDAPGRAEPGRSASDALMLRWRRWWRRMTDG
jgi:DNA-binding transcriptional MerR regulator